MKRLSIIIPFYNVEQYIAQCLDSVYQQDIPEEEYEVICVDDCSPDNSIAIVEEYAKHHANLVIVRNQYNRKLGGTRNAGMDVAIGKYVWFVDSDDFIEENCVGKLLSIAENEDLDMLHFNYAEYPNVENPTRRPQYTELMSGTDMFFDARFIWYHDLVTAWRKLYKRQFLIDNNIQFAEHIIRNMVMWHIAEKGVVEMAIYSQTTSINVDKNKEVLNFVLRYSVAKGMELTREWLKQTDLYD